MAAYSSIPAGESHGQRSLGVAVYSVAESWTQTDAPDTSTVGGSGQEAQEALVWGEVTMGSVGSHAVVMVGPAESWSSKDAGTAPSSWWSRSGLCCSSPGFCGSQWSYYQAHNTPASFQLDLGGP